MIAGLPNPAYKSAWYQANRERQCAKARANYLDNKEDRRAKMREWRLANPTWRREWLLWNHYGLTLFCFYGMLACQDFRCAICRTDDHSGSNQHGATTWHVDHDHDTGQVRGLLCNHCNTGLGHFKESPVHLAAAIEYLKRHADGG